MRITYLIISHHIATYVAVAQIRFCLVHIQIFFVYTKCKKSFFQKTELK